MQNGKRVDLPTLYVVKPTDGKNYGPLENPSITSDFCTDIYDSWDGEASLQSLAQMGKNMVATSLFHPMFHTIIFVHVSVLFLVRLTCASGHKKPGGRVPACLACFEGGPGVCCVDRPLPLGHPA